ncbi:hypothetical protein FQA39_LY12105 [Lamprigera yunnana]|nr:hypothetical protein FQA39_LY12105 [Lamprigera yunnana]
MRCLWVPMCRMLASGLCGAYGVSKNLIHILHVMITEITHMKLFVDTDSDTRLARDINERGRDLDQVLNQYINFVTPAFENFCSPTKKFADVIIPRGADNTVAIDLVVQDIREFLNNRQRSDEKVLSHVALIFHFIATLVEET